MRINPLMAGVALALFALVAAPVAHAGNPEAMAAKSQGDIVDTAGWSVLRI